MASGGTPQSYLHSVRPKLQQDNSMAQDNTSSGNPYGYGSNDPSNLPPQSVPSQYPNNRYIPPMFNPATGQWGINGSNQTSYSLPSGYAPNAGGGMPTGPGQGGQYSFQPYNPNPGNGQPAAPMMPNFNRQSTFPAPQGQAGNPQPGSPSIGQSGLLNMVSNLGLGANPNQAAQNNTAQDTYMLTPRGHGAAMQYTPQFASGVGNSGVPQPGDPQAQAGLNSFLSSANNAQNASSGIGSGAMPQFSNPMSLGPVSNALFGGGPNPMQPSNAPATAQQDLNQQQQPVAQPHPMSPRDRMRNIYPQFRSMYNPRQGGGYV